MMPTDPPVLPSPSLSIGLMLSSLDDSGTDDPCGHGLAFDADAARGLPTLQVRQRWPRLQGTCPGCGFTGIAYASFAHAIAWDG